MKQRLVLFDLDGTLLDSADIIVEAQRQAFAELALPAPTRARSLSIVGLSLNEAFTELVGADGPVEALCEAYKDAFMRCRARGTELERLFPGAQDALDHACALPNSFTGIATGKSQRGVNIIVETYSWQGRFQTVQTSDDAPSKPHPGMILQASAQCGVQPAQAIMIGDSAFDMAMAKAAGAYALAVSWGFQDVDGLDAAGADEIVHDFEALKAALSRLSQA